MVNYWDASAVVALLAKERSLARYSRLADESEIVTWWGTSVECVSAIERRAREGSSAQATAESYRNLADLTSAWREVHPSDGLRRAAIRLLKIHRLRASDALQLAAAVFAGGFEAYTVRFLTEDVRLKQAAEREGFVVG